MAKHKNGAKKLMPNESISEGKLILSESFGVDTALTDEAKELIKKDFLQAASDGKKMVLKPRIEAIHAGRTKNHHIFLEEKLMGRREDHSGVHSFTYPYPKPMLINHDTRVVANGRITDAQYISDSSSGKAAIVISPEITEQEAVERLLDGRYLTVSVGCSTNAAICNICGVNQLEDWCEHYRGETYGDVVCGWVLGDLVFNECSFVNVPADDRAMVVSLGSPVIMETYATDGENVNEYKDGERLSIESKLAKTLGVLDISEALENPEEKNGESAENQEEEEPPKATEGDSHGEEPSSVGEGEEESNEGEEPPASSGEEPPNSEEPPTTEEKISISKEEFLQLSSLISKLSTQPNEEIEEELKQAKENISSLEEENEQLVNDKADIISSTNQEKVDIILDIYAFLKNETEGDPTKYEGLDSEKIAEALTKAINDLKEAANKPITYEIENPGSNNAGEESNAKTLTKQDVLINLLKPQKK